MQIIMVEKEHADDILHYGVPGMKWGVRKARPKYYEDKRTAYKRAKSDYNKAFKKANRYSSTHFVSQFVGKKAKAESDRRWTDAYDKAKSLDKAKKEYKNAKAKYKKDTKAASKKQNNYDKRITAAKVNKVIEKVLVASLADDIFYRGAGKATVKKGADFVATKIAGKMAVREAERIIRRG